MKLFITEYKIKNIRKENNQMVGILTDLRTGISYLAYYSTSEHCWLYTEEA